LERLEKSQNVLAALMRIQIYENRLSTLEVERQGLLAEEKQLTAEIEKIAPIVQQEEAANVPRLVQTSPGAEPALRFEPSPIKIRHGEATQRVREIKQRVHTIDETVAAMRQRIAAIEKSLEDETH
jgi:prefoldin subunit 5